ncbi:MAG: TldD/PmbA family protein [Deltaproteobacteria bacterium]|nr:TldD/PmbA family protein [Deltaproteobacteria bacterium]
MTETMKKTAQSAVQALQAAGADKALANVSYTITHEFNVDGGEFSLFRTLFDKQLTMTAIQGGRKGTVSQNRYDDATIAESAKACLDAAASAQPDENWDFAPMSENKDFVLGEVRPDTDKLFSRCQELLAAVKERYPKIIMEQMIVAHKETISAKANSYGVLYSTHQGCYEVELMFSGHEGEKASSFFGSGVVTDSLEKPFLEMGSIAEDLANVEKQIETAGVEGKFEGTMVLMPGCVGSLLWSLMENFAGEGGLLSGTSPWKDQLGEMVADERITVSFAPLDERIVCGSRVTGEGFQAENYDVILNGKLNAFALGLYAANKLKLPRGGNDSYNVVVAAGDKPLSEIIASVDKGILVGRFSGGEPASNGDFSGVAKNSFLIENGKIGPALSETMISGNMADMLKHLRAISAEQVVDGMSVLPYMAFDGITISGK